MRSILRFAALATLLLCACGDSARVQKALKLDGEACLEDAECANARCLDKFCRARCETDLDCKNPELMCSRGGCLPRPEPECGNGKLEGTEECDDHNLDPDDGCSPTCQIEQPECGNGKLEGTEECDDHNLDPDDGCSPTCEIEEVTPTAAWSTGNWSACSTTCGTGTRSRSVECRAGAAIVADALCKEAKPASSEECTDRSNCTCTAGTATYTTAGVTPVTVPGGCTSLVVEAWGGGGSGGNQIGATGGGGAYATAKLPVTGGETLSVEVGEGGQSDSSPYGLLHGNGGGASSVRRGGTVLLIAGAGGGGGSDGNGGNSSGGAGGAGGGDIGQAGTAFVATSTYYCASAGPGLGGTQSAGGQGGAAVGGTLLTDHLVCSGGNGAKDQGGASNGGTGSPGGFGRQCNDLPGPIGWESGGGEANGRGGAGGAGWYGGGGAGFIWTYCAGGGGGGSSHADASATQVQLIGGDRQAQGSAVNSMGSGRGGDVNGSGADGRIVLRWGE